MRHRLNSTCLFSTGKKGYVRRSFSLSLASLLFLFSFFYSILFLLGSPAGATVSTAAPPLVAFLLNDDGHDGNIIIGGALVGECLAHGHSNNGSRTTRNDPDGVDAEYLVARLHNVGAVDHGAVALHVNRVAGRTDKNDVLARKILLDESAI